LGIDFGTFGGDVSYGASINTGGQATGSASVSGGFDLRAFVYSDGHMTNLGTLSGGVDSYGNGINDSGQVTGYGTYGGHTGVTHAFLYSDGMMVDLGTLGGASSIGYGINNDGQVTGSASLTGDRSAVVDGVAFTRRPA